MDPIYWLCAFAFLAGFIDSVCGGGGLIQLPAMLLAFPSVPIPVIFGTNKFSAFAGTSMAAWQYSRKIKYRYPVLLSIAAAAMLASYLGAKVVSGLNIAYLRQIVFGTLVLIAAYSFWNKDLGKYHGTPLKTARMIVIGVLMGILIGFYDGLIGPGTGSFFVLAFVLALHFDFLHASAYTKIVNALTNLGALIAFVIAGNIMWHVALPMAVFNVSGGFIGSRMALKRGNRFIRIIFLVVVSLLILRFSYDVFF